MPRYNVTVKVRYFVYVDVDARSQLDASKAAREIADRCTPHELPCNGYDSERSDVDVIGIEEEASS